MGIAKVMNQAVTYGLKRPLNRVANTGLMKNVCKNFQDGNMKYIAAWAVGSMVLKDGLGCYMYVKQSLANKDIPEEKRKFVAALDLANGGLMILAQLIMFKTISNKAFQDKMFNKVFGKYFERAAKKGYKDVIRTGSEFKGMNGKEFGKEFNMAFDKFHGNIKNTFGLLTTLVASTIIAKRIIVPFIATPLAEKAKGLLSKGDDKNKEAHKDTFTQSANVSK